MAITEGNLNPAAPEQSGDKGGANYVLGMYVTYTSLQKQPMELTIYLFMVLYVFDLLGRVLL